MGTHNIIIQEARTQAWLDHKTFHQRYFSELCVFCQEDLQKAQADHIAGEVLEQELEDRGEVEE
jgi:hypothetical protein